MKKIFALALAAVMAAGMTTVAFAADAENIEIGTNLFKYDSDAGYGVVVSGVESAGDLKPGATYYISLNVDGVEDCQVSSVSVNELTKSIASKYKVYTDWKVGEIEDFSIEYRKLALIGSGNETGYRYVVEFTVPEIEDAKTFDIAGEISVAKSKTAAKDATTVDLDATVGNYTTISDDTIDATDLSLVKFDSDAELTDVEITWGNDEVAMFEVNVAGQGKLNLAYNVDFDTEVAALDNTANMDFVTFEGEPTFNRNGKLYIYADADTYLYQVKDGKLVAVDAEYDEDYEAWTLTTRTLGRYVISDKELEEQVITDGDEDTSSSTTEDGGKENPDTGR